LRERYFDHVARHFDDGAAASEWDYFTQVQNLLRQKALKATWKQNVWQKSIRNRLRWQPRGSADLRRILECRHLGDISKLVAWAYHLGSGAHDVSEGFPEGFSRPLLETCPLASSGHKTLLRAEESGGDFSFQISRIQQPAPQLIYLRGGKPGPPRLRTLHTISEPEGEGHPHPGTPMHIPDSAPKWPEDETSMFGPPVSELGEPIAVPDSALPHWPIPTSGMEVKFEPSTAVRRPKTPKRPLSGIARKSIENLRLKRRNAPGSPSMVDTPPMPGATIPTAGFALPMRSHHQNITSHPGFGGQASFL
jgi:hypothetical protein